MIYQKEKLRKHNRIKKSKIPRNKLNKEAERPVL